jgi:hypothetical protein
MNMFGVPKYTVNKGCDDLVVGHVRKLSATHGEVVYVLLETLTLLLPAMAKLAGIAVPGVGALEVPYEVIPELSPAADPPQGRCLSQVRTESARYSGMLLMMNRSLVAPPLWQVRR